MLIPSVNIERVFELMELEKTREISDEEFKSCISQKEISEEKFNNIVKEFQKNADTEFLQTQTESLFVDKETGQ